MAKVMEKTGVHERDLRAKVASESGSLAEASERLGHADTAITQRAYRRKPVRVQPLKKCTKTGIYGTTGLLLDSHRFQTRVSH